MCKCLMSEKQKKLNSLKKPLIFLLGSGSLAAMAVFEKGFRPNLEVRLLVSKSLFLLLLFSMFSFSGNLEIKN